MGVQPNVVLSGQDSALTQQLRRHGERRAGGQCHTAHGAVAVIVVFLDTADAVCHDLVYRLHHAIRRQAAVLDAQVHAAPAHVEANAQLPCGAALCAQQVTAMGGEHIVVVKAGGAAMLHQFAHAGQAGQANYILIQVFPDLIQGLQPVKQLHVLHLRQIAGEHLVQVVVGVDQTGVAQHMAAVDDLVGGDVQRRADGLDKAILTVKVRVMQYAVFVVAGDQLVNVLNEQGGHGNSSLW